MEIAIHFLFQRFLRLGAGAAPLTPSSRGRFFACVVAPARAAAIRAFLSFLFFPLACTPFLLALLSFLTFSRRLGRRDALRCAGAGAAAASLFGDSGRQRLWRRSSRSERERCRLGVNGEGASLGSGGAMMCSGGCPPPSCRHCFQQYEHRITSHSEHAVRDKLNISRFLQRVPWSRGRIVQLWYRSHSHSSLEKIF